MVSKGWRRSGWIHRSGQTEVSGCIRNVSINIAMRNHMDPHGVQRSGFQSGYMQECSSAYCSSSEECLSSRQCNHSRAVQTKVQRRHCCMCSPMTDLSASGYLRSERCLARSRAFIVPEDSSITSSSTATTMKGETKTCRELFRHRLTNPRDSGYPPFRI